MYLQIMEQIKRRVAAGDWPGGGDIPSIRELAVALRVSVITVKRAYLELEREGIIVTQQGRGSFVAPQPDLPPRLREAELTQLLEQVARLGFLLRVPTKSLLGRLEEAIQNVEENNVNQSALAKESR